MKMTPFWKQETFLHLICILIFCILQTARARSSGGAHFHSDAHGYYDPMDSHHQHDGPYGNKNTQGSCTVPESWRGRWFQSGLNLQAVTIDEKSIATKGICLESHQDKFLFYDKTLNCHKCLVINERHQNVLQYKESPDCEPERDSLENLCSSINGDAQLFSLFRLDAEPQDCPFRGAPFNLTYNRGHGECREPVSRVDSCTDPSKLLLRFQACPNVDKTESKVEELECLAEWREGSNHYLLGKLESPLGNSNYEEKYRCFIWKRIKEHEIGGHAATIKYQVAQSGDATCAGVQSATEGARALTLIKLDQGNVDKCKFPHWVSTHHWHTLDGKTSFKIQNHKNATLHVTQLHKNSSSSTGGIGGTSSRHRSDPFFFPSGSRISCQSRHDVSNHHATIFAQHIDGCKSQSLCLNLWKRDSHVVEVELRRVSAAAECMGRSETPADSTDGVGWITLVSATPSSHRCPNLGKYMATGVSGDGRMIRDNCGGNPGNGDLKAVAVGCGETGTIEFHSNCATHQPITSYTCHASWREGETGFLIASPTSRSSTAIRRFCFMYTETEAGLRVSSSSDSCRRNSNPGIEGNWAFHLTTQGPCAERLTSRGSAPLKPLLLNLLPFISVITTILHFLAST